MYALAGVAWILASDRALELLAGGAGRAPAYQALKGISFVLATGALLFVLLRRREAERRAQAAFLRAVLDGVADAVLLVDPEGRVVDVNAAAVRLLGARSRRALLGPLAELADRTQLSYPDGRRMPPERTPSARALRGETVIGEEARLRRLDGLDLFVGVSAGPVQAPGEPRPHAVSVVRDMSEVTRLEEAREEFIAEAAHEFRTPLAVVKASAQMLRRRRDPDPAALDGIARQVDRMTRMLQQLLEVSRFRLGGADLRREPFDLAALLREVAGGLGDAADGRSVAVRASAAAVVLGDRARIGRVIGRLLDNALRFEPRGGHVDASLEVRGDGAVVLVHDHGPGIPPERQAAVFERWHRAGGSFLPDYGAVGQGLDVSRDIVVRHGGRIWLESAPGKGSTFAFSLPLLPAAPPAEGAP